MRDLDNRAQSLMKEIDSHAEDYLKVVSQTSPEKRKEQMEKIQKLFNKAKEYGDDKVQLAIQTYELVSRSASSVILNATFVACNARLINTSGVWTQTWPGLKQKLKKNLLLPHYQQKKILHQQPKV